MSKTVAKKQEPVSELWNSYLSMEEAKASLAQRKKDFLATMAKASAEEAKACEKHGRAFFGIAAEAGDKAAVRAIMAVMNEVYPWGSSLSKEEASGLISAFSKETLKREDLMEGGAPNRLSKILIAAVREVPGAYGSPEIIGGLISAEMPTNSFINTVFRSDLTLEKKAKGAALCKGDRENPLQADILDRLERQFVANVRESYSHDRSNVGKHMQEIIDFLNKEASLGEVLVKKVVEAEECAYAAPLAALVPSSFQVAMEAVLTSGSPMALAAFYRAHSQKCDKKAFHEKLSEAMRPDPEAMARAILDGRGHMHPMMHPMMIMGPMRYMYER